MAMQTPRQHIRRESDRRNLCIAAFGEWIAAREPKPMFLVDERRAEIFTNAAAHHIQKHDNWIRIVDRRLEIANSELFGRLNTVLSQWPDPQRRSIRLDIAGKHLEVARLQVSGTHLKAYAVIVPTTVRKRVSYARLMQEYSLSKAQAQIAVAIYEGATQAQIAERRRIKLNTVRTHVQNVFKRLAVHSQRDVVRLVGALAVNPWD